MPLPEGASLKNGMRGSGDFEDMVLAARAGGGGRPGVGVLGANGRSVSAGVVAGKEKEKEKEKEKKGSYAKGFERSFLARVGRSVSADKEKEKMRHVS